MLTKTTKKCPNCGAFLWLTEIGEFWDEYACDDCGSKFTTEGLKGFHGETSGKLQEEKC